MSGVTNAAQWTGCVAVGLLAVSVGTAAYRPAEATPRADRPGPAIHAPSGERRPTALARAGCAPHLATPVQVTAAVSGSIWSHQSTITDTIGAGFFGASLTLSGTTALVGAPALQGGPTAVGVYVRSGATWTQQDVLNGGAQAAWFGGSVALRGDTALVGAPHQNNVTGAAYVFVRHGAIWTQQATFTDPAPAIYSDDFGFSVALSGDTALVSAAGKNNGTGLAYVYVRHGTTWTRQAALAAPDGVAQDDFGYAVALSGETAVVGAPLKGNSLGAVYAFERSGTTWTPQQELQPTPAVSGEEFGNAVALQGTTAVVGAPAYPSASSFGAGAAYVFARDLAGWSQQALLTANDGGRVDNFGWSVALSGDTALIGADYEFNHGAAHIFVRSGTTWSEQALLAERHGMYGDFFGSAVALEGNTALIATNLNRGADVYVYERRAATG